MTYIVKHALQIVKSILAAAKLRFQSIHSLRSKMIAFPYIEGVESAHREKKQAASESRVKLAHRAQSNVGAFLRAADERGRDAGLRRQLLAVQAESNAQAPQAFARRPSGEIGRARAGIDQRLAHGITALFFGVHVDIRTTTSISYALSARAL